MWAALPRASVNESSNCVNQDKVTGTVWLFTFLHYMSAYLKGGWGHNSTYQATLGPKQRFIGSTNKISGCRL